MKRGFPDCSPDTRKGMPDGCTRGCGRGATENIIVDDEKQRHGIFAAALLFFCISGAFFRIF